jgi:hypothetical protein
MHCSFHNHKLNSAFTRLHVLFIPEQPPLPKLGPGRVYVRTTDLKVNEGVAGACLTVILRFIHDAKRFAGVVVQ